MAARRICRIIEERIRNGELTQEEINNIFKPYEFDEEDYALIERKNCIDSELRELRSRIKSNRYVKSID